MKAEEVMRLRYIAIPALLLVSVAGCKFRSATIEGGRYRAPTPGFEVTMPAGNWEATEGPDENAVTFRREGSPSRIAVQAREKESNASLDILSRHLLVHFPDKKIIASGSGEVYGEPAVFVVAEAIVDGQPVKLKAWTFVSADVVYDVVLWSRAESFDKEVRLLGEFLDGLSVPRAHVGEKAE